MTGHIQITFPGLQPEQQDVLIAHLAEAGFEGFEQNDEELRAYIPAGLYDKALLQEMAFKYQLGYSEELIPEQNWNSVWESGFSPVIVDDFVAIRAGFHEPVAGVEHELVITPKMSFGTGHHATTSMMIRQMRSIDFTDKSVFDFGTGTGILAILSEKLGAAKVLAIDNDEWSITNAEENIKGNSCRKIQLANSDRPPGPDQFDIVLANINRNVILENFPALSGLLAPGCIVLLSGLLAADEENILRVTESHSLQLCARLEQNNWICLRFRH